MAEKANDRQVGGGHYKIGGEEHWDRVSRLNLDYFQGQITKYVERWKNKNGVEDLKKARHFLDKYIELHEPPTMPDLLNPDPDPLPFYRPGLSTYPANGHIEFGPDIEDIARSVIKNNALYDKLRTKGPILEHTEHRNPEVHPSVESFGGERAPDGWIGYTFEGSDAGGELYRCTNCSASFRVLIHANPNHYHSCAFKREIPVNPGGKSE